MTTLRNWKEAFASDGFRDQNRIEIELRKKIGELESALAEFALENHILPAQLAVKKAEKALREYRQKEKSLKIASLQSLVSSGAARP